MKGKDMTVNEILYVMENDQPVQIVWVDTDNWREEVMYDDRVGNMCDFNIWDEWEPIKILTPDDNSGTIRLVC